MYKLYIKQCFIIYKSIKLVLKERLKKVIIYIYRRKKCVQKFSASVFEFNSILVKLEISFHKVQCEMWVLHR